MEKWIDINGYEGIYQVSDLGRIKSIGRIKFCGKKNKIGMFYKEKILTGNVNSHGYARVNLWKDNKPKHTLVHCIVASVFLKKESHHTDINHKNGIKTDNRVDNLERCTRSHNLKHAYSTGLKSPTWKGKFGKDHPNSRKIKQYDLEGNEIAVFFGQTEASRKLGISQASISGGCKDPSKIVAGYRWSFA